MQETTARHSLTRFLPAGKAARHLQCRIDARPVLTAILCPVPSPEQPDDFMTRLFYRSNFCAECGNRREQSGDWRPGCFCDHCSRRTRHRLWGPLSLICAGLLCGIIIGGWWKKTTQSGAATLSSVTVPVVSAQDATATLRPATTASARLPEAAFLCGARTKKGTPCKHRVAQAGERCAQHQGRASLLK